LPATKHFGLLGPFVSYEKIKCSEYRPCVVNNGTKKFDKIVPRFERVRVFEMLLVVHDVVQAAVDHGAFWYGVSASLDVLGGVVGHSCAD